MLDQDVDKIKPILDQQGIHNTCSQSNASPLDHVTNQLIHSTHSVGMVINPAVWTNSGVHITCQMCGNVNMTLLVACKLMRYCICTL